MVPGRAGKCETVVPVKGSLSRANGCTCGIRCNLERAAADIRVVVNEVLSPVGAQLPDHPYMGGRVDTQQVID
jgi:hypothetical protein